MTAIIDKLKAISEIRAELTEKTEEKRIIQEKFVKNNENLFDDITCLKLSLGEAEKIVKDMAIEEFKKTNNKKLPGGMGIRIMRTIGYNEDVALIWAKNHKLALDLNKKEFEKIAGAIDIDFVYFENKTIATIPREIKIGGDE